MLKPSLALHQEIGHVLTLYTNNFSRSTNSENLLYSHLLDLAKKLFPDQDATAMIASLFSLFFIQALSAPSNDTFADEDFI